MTFHTLLEGDILQCTLCPNGCRIKKGTFGSCSVRYNNEGKLELPLAGRISGLAMDPIEKKPLFHFFPGRKILSAGFYGCSLHCPFCQNHTISQAVDRDAPYYSPEDLVRTALDRGSFAIAYTYNEPTIHAEYVLETAGKARKNGLKNVLVTNGYVQEETGRVLIAAMDAANIDLKSFSDIFYRRELHGRLQPVLDFITAAAGKIHVEATTLVIPGKNDSEEEITQIAQFLAGLNPSLPLHLSCYYPVYKYRIPATRPESVERLAETARRHLDYVYTGNTGASANDTFCRICGSLLIRRRYYSVEIAGVVEGKCGKCGTETEIPGL